MSLAIHLRQSLELTAFIVDAFLQDLSDDELFVRPSAGMNHIAWQLGHLIASENSHINLVTSGQMPPLPEGFGGQHSQATSAVDDPGSFRTKSEYLALMAEQRSATLGLLAGLSDHDLQESSPESIRYLGPTVACVFSGTATHWMMHSGQWSVVRRKLGRPPLF